MYILHEDPGATWLIFWNQQASNGRCTYVTTSMDRSSATTYTGRERNSLHPILFCSLLGKETEGVSWAGANSATLRQATERQASGMTTPRKAIVALVY